MTRICGLVLALVLLASPVYAANDYAEKALQSGAEATGDGQAITTLKFDTVAVDVSISGTATITFEGSVSGVAWTTLAGHCVSTVSPASAAVSTATATGIYQCNVAGLTAFRARISAYTDGTVSAFARASTSQLSRGINFRTDVNGSILASFTNCFSGESICIPTSPNSYMMIHGGTIRDILGVTDQITDTTSPIFTLPTGAKTPRGKITGTGAIEQIQKTYGSYDTSTVVANAKLLSTCTLNGTTTVATGCSPAQFTEDWPNYFIVTEGSTGTILTQETRFGTGIAASSASAGGAGDASLAEQQTQTTALQIIDNIVSGTGANISQINGVTPLMGAGNTGTGSPRVTEAADSQLSAGVGATGDAVATPGSTGSLTAKLRLLTNLAWNPCATIAWTHIPIDIVTATTTEITPALAGASTHYYVCGLDLITAGANNVALVDDDSDGCGSPTSGMAGGVTAAEGWNLVAGGGLVKAPGMGFAYKTNGTNRVICLVTSAATQLSGSMQVVAAP